MPPNIRSTPALCKCCSTGTETQRGCGVSSGRSPNPSDVFLGTNSAGPVAAGPGPDGPRSPFQHQPFRASATQHDMLCLAQPGHSQTGFFLLLLSAISVGSHCLLRSNSVPIKVNTKTVLTFMEPGLWNTGTGITTAWVEPCVFLKHAPNCPVQTVMQNQGCIPSTARQAGTSPKASSHSLRGHHQPRGLNPCLAGTPACRLLAWKGFPGLQALELAVPPRADSWLLAWQGPPNRMTSFRPGKVPPDCLAGFWPHRPSSSGSHFVAWH